MTTRTITCPTCSHAFAVAADARTAICHKCGRALPILAAKISFSREELKRKTPSTSERDPDPGTVAEPAKLARIALRKRSSREESESAPDAARRSAARPARPRPPGERSLSDAFELPPVDTEPRRNRVAEEDLPPPASVTLADLPGDGLATEESTEHQPLAGRKRGGRDYDVAILPSKPSKSSKSSKSHRESSETNAEVRTGIDLPHRPMGAGLEPNVLAEPPGAEEHLGEEPLIPVESNAEEAPWASEAAGEEVVEDDWQQDEGARPELEDPGEASFGGVSLDDLPRRPSLDETVREAQGSGLVGDEAAAEAADEDALDEVPTSPESSLPLGLPPPLPPIKAPRLTAPLPRGTAPPIVPSTTPSSPLVPPPPRSPSARPLVPPPPPSAAIVPPPPRPLVPPPSAAIVPPPPGPLVPPAIPPPPAIVPPPPAIIPPPLPPIRPTESRDAPPDAPDDPTVPVLSQERSPVPEQVLHKLSSAFHRDLSPSARIQALSTAIEDELPGGEAPAEEPPGPPFSSPTSLTSPGLGPEEDPDAPLNLPDTGIVVIVPERPIEEVPLNSRLPAAAPAPAPPRRKAAGSTAELAPVSRRQRGAARGHGVALKHSQEERPRSRWLLIALVSVVLVLVGVGVAVLLLGKR